MKYDLAKILKLSNELRSKGYSKYADELDYKFLILKKSEAELYSVFKETGESLLADAHPEGSVKMHDAKDEGGVVETLPDQKNKIEKAILKNPTGKLSSKQIINLIKSADTPSIPDLIPSAAGEAAAAAAGKVPYQLGAEKWLNKITSKIVGAVKAIGPAIKANKTVAGASAVVAGIFSLAKVYQEYHISEDLTDSLKLIEKTEELIPDTTELSAANKASMSKHLFSFKQVINVFKKSCDDISLLDPKAFRPDDPRMEAAAKALLANKKLLDEAVSNINAATAILKPYYIKRNVMPFTNIFEIDECVDGVSKIILELKNLVDMSSVGIVSSPTTQQPKAHTKEEVIKELDRLLGLFQNETNKKNAIAWKNAINSGERTTEDAIKEFISAHNPSF